MLVAEWEHEYEAGERYRNLVTAHEAWRARRGVAAGIAVPGARFVLLHTLAHLLIHHASEEDDTLHAAACHACLFAPETSCEHANRYLDRATLVPILGNPGDAYFQPGT